METSLTDNTVAEPVEGGVPAVDQLKLLVRRAQDENAWNLSNGNHHVARPGWMASLCSP